MSKFAKLLNVVVSATKRPELPEDHTGSQASMAAQRATGQAEADMQDALKAAATERNGACDRLLKFLGRAFGSRTDPMATRRAQRVAVKAVAFMSKDEALFATRQTSSLTNCTAWHCAMAVQRLARTMNRQPHMRNRAGQIREALWSSTRHAHQPD
ncbi:hypothetical protein OKW43_007898 [Paraburkholderia sp. WC7.3g]